MTARLRRSTSAAANMRRNRTRSDSEADASIMAITGDEPLETDNPTLLFASRKLSKNDPQLVSENDQSPSKPPKNMRRRFSTSSLQSQHFTPPRPEAPRISGMSLAAHKFANVSLKMFKGVKAHGGSNKYLRYGVADSIGRRPYNEDRHCTLPNFGWGGAATSEQQSLFGVFDGHGGDLASSYCVDSIPSRLKKAVAKPSLKSSEIKEALVAAFEGTDDDFCMRARRSYLDDGTTAVAVLIRNGKVFCANAGDSRAVLSRRAIAVKLSDDHKPNRLDEKNRILKLGGFIKHLGVWRTQGVLAVSRAIGDVSLKPYVIATPELVEMKLQPEDEFIVLASDGLWDVMTNQEVVDMLHSRSNLLDTPEMAARALVTEAYRRRSYDNITALVVTLGNQAAKGNATKGKG